MTVPFLPGLPGFSLTPTPAVGGTAFTAIIPPYSGPRTAPLLYSLVNGRPNWYGEPYTHLSSLLYSTVDTVAHTIYVLRPLNWTTVATAVPKNTPTIVLTDDPGIYTTNYRYPMPGSFQTFNPPGTANTNGPTQVATAAISTANKYIAYQFDDGTWTADVVTGISGLSLTVTGTPNRTGATIAAGRPVFFFGAVTLSNPANGVGQPKIVTPALTAAYLTSNPIPLQQLLGGYNGEAIPAFNPGDPLLFYSSNTTTAAGNVILCGDYRKF